jgi:hypothetical protein
LFFGVVPWGNLAGGRSVAPLMVLVGPPFLGAVIGSALYRVVRRL